MGKSVDNWTKTLEWSPIMCPRTIKREDTVLIYVFKIFSTNIVRIKKILGKYPNFRILRFFKGKNLDYKAEIKSIIDNLQEQGRFITNFVADNLIAQKNELEGFFETNLSKLNVFKSDNPGIIFCPWQCYTLSLSIKDLNKKSKFYW